MSNLEIVDVDKLIMGVDISRPIASLIIDMNRWSCTGISNNVLGISMEVKAEEAQT